jgi:hypothetical protein
LPEITLPLRLGGSAGPTRRTLTTAVFQRLLVDDQAIPSRLTGSVA